MAKERKSIKGQHAKNVVTKGTEIKNPPIKQVPERGVVAVNIRPRPADIILTKSKVDLNGTEVKIFGDRKNKIATFDSKTTKLIVHKKLIVGQIDIALKLRNLEARIQKLES